MTLSAQCYEFSWRRPHVAALLAGSVLALAALAWRGHAREWFDRTPTVMPDRASASAELIDPNEATAASLQRLSLIGPVIAQAIIEYRAIHGGRAFHRPEDLMEVPGIGPVTVQRIAPYLTFDTDGQQR